MITIYTSRNYGDRAERCGATDERIEPGEPCIYVKTGRHGNDAKPRALFELVVGALRRGGWESMIPEVLGLDVYLIQLPSDELVIVAGKLVYTASYGEAGGHNRYCSARSIAEQIAQAIGTPLQVLNLMAYDDFESFMAEYGIDPDEWWYPDFALALQEMKRKEAAS